MMIADDLSGGGTFCVDQCLLDKYVSDAVSVCLCMYVFCICLYLYLFCLYLFVFCICLYLYLFCLSDMSSVRF